MKLQVRFKPGYEASSQVKCGFPLASQPDSIPYLIASQDPAAAAENCHWRLATKSTGTQRTPSHALACMQLGSETCPKTMTQETMMWGDHSWYLKPVNAWKEEQELQLKTNSHERYYPLKLPSPPPPPPTIHLQIKTKYGWKTWINQKNS